LGNFEEVRRLIKEFDANGEITSIGRNILPDTVRHESINQQIGAADCYLFLQKTRNLILLDSAVSEFMNEYLFDTSFWYEDLNLCKESGQIQLRYSVIGKTCDCPEKSGKYNSFTITRNLDSLKIFEKKFIIGESKNVCIRAAKGEE